MARWERYHDRVLAFKLFFNSSTKGSSFSASTKSLWCLKVANTPIPFWKKTYKSTQNWFQKPKKLAQFFGLCQIFLKIQPLPLLLYCSLSLPQLRLLAGPGECSWIFRTEEKWFPSISFLSPANHLCLSQPELLLARRCPTSWSGSRAHTHPDSPERHNGVIYGNLCQTIARPFQAIVWQKHHCARHNGVIDWILWQLDTRKCLSLPWLLPKLWSQRLQHWWLQCLLQEHPERNVICRIAAQNCTNKNLWHPVLMEVVLQVPPN